MGNRLFGAWTRFGVAGATCVLFLLGTPHAAWDDNPPGDSDGKQAQAPPEPGERPQQSPQPEASKTDKTADKPDSKDDKNTPEKLIDVRKGPKNPGPHNLPPYDRLTEYGTLPSSNYDDGGLYLPLDERVSEVFQHLDPREQIRQGQLLGSQLPPALLEYRVLTKEVRAGEEVRAVARLWAANKARSFTSLFTHLDYGRARSAVDVVFEPSQRDPNLFLGRAVLPKHLIGGRYVIRDMILTDESGHRKGYWPDWNPVLQESDGTPIGFVVPENPNADITPPQLTKVKVHETSVKISQNIHMDIWVEDDQSGPSEAQAYWISPSGDQSLRTDLVQVQTEPGLFRSAFQIPEFSEGGKWQLLSVKLSDKATNEGNLFSVSVPMLRSIFVDVEQDPSKVDKEAPRLLALQLSHTELSRNSELAITLLAEDDLAGMKEAYVSFLAPYGVDFTRVKLTNQSTELNRRSAGPQVNVFRGTLKLTRTQEPGLWTVSRVNLADNANNYRNYNPRRDDIVKNLNVFFSDPRLKQGESTTGVKK